jgi:cytosine/adenosine deaminase-related metal-dependent hydrolase/SAM-dependent methyltransferase
MAKAATIVEVEEGYRLWSEVYDDAPNPLLALEERVLGPLLGEVRGKRVVDLGCGTGRWLARLQEREAASLTGVDVSPEMLARARAKHRCGTRLICARGDQLPLRSASADVILCSFTLGYLADLNTFVREVARIAAPGASVLISDFHPEAHARGWRRSFRCGGEEIEVRNFVYAIADIQRAFKAAGLDCSEALEAPFGEAERSIFAAAGKEDLFAAAAGAGPAIFICRLRRNAQQAAARRGGDRLCELSLVDARVALDSSTAITADLEISAGCVQNMRRSGTAPAIDLSGYLVLPGLINAHDHLEFNLFPRLGEGPYRNCQEWADAIYRPSESPVREHCAVPKRARLWWGGLNNLLAGVTTVSHHNPYDADVFSDFPVRVVRRYGWAHSIARGGDIRAAYQSTPADAPFIIHLAEGTDEESESEIFELDRLGGLGPNTVIVHGVGLSERGYRLLRERSAALVWCPSSNLFTLGKTIAAETLLACRRAALGTDSALSGAGDLLDELRIARGLGVSAEWLYEMVTTGAADVLRLRDGEGTLGNGVIADLVVVRDRGATPAESLCKLRCADIEAVLVGGRPRLISSDMVTRWPVPLPSMQEITVGGIRRLVDAPVAELVQAARECIGAEFRLAGKAVS